MSKKTAAEISLALQTVADAEGLESGGSTGPQEDQSGEAQGAGETSKASKSWKTLRAAAALGSLKQKKTEDDEWNGCMGACTFAYIVRFG